MKKLSGAWAQLQEMDRICAQPSPIHRLHPLAKLAVTLCYLLCVVSFPRYQLSPLSVMLLYPVLLFQLAGIPVRTCFRKLWFVLPLICAVGIFDPVFDRRPLLRIGPFTLTAGMVSMATLMMKGIFSLMACFLLIATTPVDRLCAALRQLHLPALPLTLLLLCYRYLSVLLREAAVMSEAYALRAPGQRGIHFSAWGSFLGQLLLRSLDRATELYQSMQLRGFDGEFRHMPQQRLRPRDIAYALSLPCLFLLARQTDLPQLLGNLFM